MGYIYYIENMINHKKYVGKTLFSVEKRFNQHVADSQREGIKERPLYRAFHKYGIENFQCFVLEECQDEILDMRECFWIQKLGTFHKGYNATLGGEGTKKIIIEEAVLRKMYEEHKTPRDVAQFYNCSLDLVSSYSNRYGIYWSGHQQRHDIQCMLGGTVIKEFYSAGEAARWLIENNYSSAECDSLIINIMRCCKNTRRSCCNFQWKFKAIGGLV